MSTTEAGPSQVKAAPRHERQAATSARSIELPVVVDPSGRAWALPAVTAVAGTHGALLETATLDSEVVAAALAQAQATQAPGSRRTYTVDLGGIPTPAVEQWDGWALGEELLGTDLALGGDAPAEPGVLGYAVEARLQAPDAADSARLMYLRQPHGPGIRVVGHAPIGSVVGRDVAFVIVGVVIIGFVVWRIREHHREGSGSQQSQDVASSNR